MKTATVLLLSLTIDLFFGSDAAKILGMFPYHGLSHFLVFKPLLIELAERGHEVVVASNFPLSREERVANYRDIDLSKTVADVTNNVTLFSPINGKIFETMFRLYLHLDEDDRVLSSDRMRRFLRSGEKFDLMLTEYFVSRVYFAFAYEFGIPTVALSSCRLMPWASYDLANPLNPAYIPNILGSSTDRMDFWERLINTVELATATVIFETIFEWKSKSIVTKHFGAGFPAPRTLARNVSLMLSPGYSGANLVRPSTAAVIEVGGLYIKRAKPVPQKILD